MRRDDYATQTLSPFFRCLIISVIFIGLILLTGLTLLGMSLWWIVPIVWTGLVLTVINNFLAFNGLTETN